MTTKEFKKMSVAELEAEFSNLLRESFNLRMQRATGQLNKFHLIKNARRNIARIKTILGAEKERMKTKHE